MPIDYNNSKIYKIIDNTNGNIYIGSTTQKLSQRLGEHTRQYKKYCIGKFHYLSSFDIIKNMSYEIILIEEVNCSNKEQLLKIEREHIEANECINIRIPSRSQKEYIEYQKEYNYVNRDKIKDHYEANRDKIKEHYEANRDEIIEKQKKYNELNKDTIKEYKKHYRETNKQTIKEKRKQYYEDNKKKKQQEKESE